MYACVFVCVCACMCVCACVLKITCTYVKYLRKFKANIKLHCQVLAIDSLGSTQLKAMLHYIYSVATNWDGIYDNDAGI